MLSILKRYRAWRVAQDGVWPFIPSTLAALLSTTCILCGRQINVCSIFGNSIVTSNGAVNLICLHCRSGGEYSIREPEEKVQNSLLRSIDFREVVIALGENEFGDAEEAMAPILGLRTGLGKLQSERYDSAFSPKMRETSKDHIYSGDPVYQAVDYVEPITHRYESLMSVGNCGECGATWRNAGEENHSKIKKDGCCFSCKIPNHYQWHMRSTLKEEVERLRMSI